MRTVMSARYLEMLTNYIYFNLQKLNALSDVVWIQDDASSNVGSTVKHFLQNYLPHLTLLWPSRSIDFNGFLGGGN